jgi:protoporphyrinogen oxidase
MSKVDTLIIGGGITGLSVASFLGKEEDYLVAEASNELGGYCKTTKRNGFVWDYSGHFFHFRNKDIKEYVMEHIDTEVVEVQKITDIDYEGTIVDFPFQYNIHQLPSKDFLDCLVDLYKVGELDNSSFKSFVKSSLGESISDKFLIPYNEKLYATDLDNLDADAMGRFFPKPIDFGDLLERISSKEKFISYNDTFIYPIDGSFEFVKSILKRVDENKVSLNTKINSVDLEAKVAYTDSGEIKFNKLVNTAPFNVFMKMCGKEVNGLSSNKVAVFNLGFDKSTDIESHWRYFPGDQVFYRIGFYNNILGQDRMSLYVEIGAKQEEDLNENTLLIKVLQDLKSSGIIKDQELIEHQFIVMDPAYVHINKNSMKAYEDWCNRYNSQGIYSIGRYGSWTYCSIEDNIIQGKETANSILDL